MAARPSPGTPGGGLARHAHALAPRRVREASVVSVITNQADEGRFLDVDDVHVAPALDGIIDGLEMLLGSNIFTAEDEPVGPVSKIEKPAKLARIYKGSAEKIANRTQDDPSEATHRFSGKTILAWGKFEDAEPDVRFRVLVGSSWRPAVVDPSHAVFKQQQRVAKAQKALVEDGVLDDQTHTLTRDHIFENWTRAAHLISGVGSYAGSYHWQRLAPAE